MDRLTRYANPGNGRNLSEDLWANCPRESIMANPGIGKYFQDDFMGFMADKYTVTQATSGTFAAGAAEGGIAVANPGAATATQGVNVQVDEAQFKPQAGSKIWMEARFKWSGITNGLEFFLGLSDVDTAIIDTSAVASDNFAGWSSVTDDAVLLFNSEKATAGDTGAATTVEADTYLKLGLLIDGVDSITQFINGVKTGTAKVAANIPIVALCPSLVVQSGGTQNTCSVDWWSFFQLDD